MIWKWFKSGNIWQKEKKNYYLLHVSGQQKSSQRDMLQTEGHWAHMLDFFFFFLNIYIYMIHD